MSAKMIQLTQNGVMKYPRTIAEAVAVISKSKKLSTVLADMDAEDLRLAGLIEAAEGKITVLNGNSSVDGSVDKKIADAINAFSTQISDNGAIDTFKELVDYVAAHGSDFSALVGRMDTAEGKITTLEGKVSTLEGDNTTNKANIAKNAEDITNLNGKVGSSADAASAEGSLYARVAALKAEISAMGGDAGSISEQINSAIAANNTSVVEPISERLTEVEGTLTSKVDQSAYDAKVEELEGNISDNATAAANAQTAAGNAQSKADDAYTLAEGKIGYTVIGDTTYPDFEEIALS